MVKKREAEPGAEAATEIPVTRSSGIVFADLEFAEPEEELTKAQLASHIRQIIRRHRLTQVATAALMGIDQPKVSALLNGRLANFSGDRLSGRSAGTDSHDRMDHPKKSLPAARLTIS